MTFSSKIAGAAGALALAAALTATPAAAQGVFPADAKLDFSFNIGATNDYVFRGISQTLEDPAIQGGADATYGIFYAGVWASNVDFIQGDGGFNSGDAQAEIDLYAGITPKFGPATLDFGVIYYWYPAAEDILTNGNPEDLDYVELKAGISGDLAKNLSAGFTYFYSPDYFGGTGQSHTLEGSLSYEFQKVGIFTPSVSGLVGTTLFSDDTDIGGDYVYWNAGVGLAVENFSLDFRYWDTDEQGFANLPGLSDERFVFTASVALP